MLYYKRRSTKDFKNFLKLKKKCSKYNFPMHAYTYMQIYVCMNAIRDKREFISTLIGCYQYYTCICTIYIL